MPDLLRQEIATAAHTMIVKVGTRVLTGPDGTLSRNGSRTLLKKSTKFWTAVGIGSREFWGRRRGDGSVGTQKAADGFSAAPSRRGHRSNVLVQTYDREFRRFGRHAAQILLVADDLDHRTRYLNIRNTILNLLELGAVPIINENDTVSVEELRTTFGDNDRLAAMMTNLSERH